MNRDELIRRLRRYARLNGLRFKVETRRGNGSHYLVHLGERWTTVQYGIDEWKARRICKQLDVDYDLL